MLSIAEAIRKTIKDSGRTQTWIVNEMAVIDPTLNINRTKFSAIVCGNRKMSGMELLAFCKALKISPDYLLETKRTV